MKKQPTLVEKLEIAILVIVGLPFVAVYLLYNKLFTGEWRS